jgi:hypothetical protein
VTDLEPVLRTDLSTIQAWWPVLLDLPRSPGGHLSSYVESPPPVPIGVLSLRRHAAEQLGGWVVTMHRQRKLHTVIDLADIIAVCRFLDVHRAWLAERRKAVEQIGAIAASITELVEQTQPHRILIGRCPDCAGKLIAILRNADALLPSELRCNINPTHVWTPSQWTGLGQRINIRAIRYEVAASRLVQILAKS